MTQTETSRRLAVAERQLAQLRTEVAKLHVLVGVLLHADRPADADTEQVARAVGVVRETSPRHVGGRRLRLVDEDGSIGGRDLDEGLRRVRAGRGGDR